MIVQDQLSCKPSGRQAPCQRPATARLRISVRLPFAPISADLIPFYFMNTTLW